MMPKPMAIGQIPAPRLRIKRDVGWFPAGLEVATALDLLSDAAFKLYMFLCLNADHHSGRMVWAPQEIANQLRRDCQSVSDALGELCRQKVCVRREAAAGRFTTDRISVEICDRFWPYEKAPAEEFGVDLDHYVQQVRQMMLKPACVRSRFSPADERLAIELYRRGVTLIHLQRAFWLGCARKYVSLLNAEEYTPRLISSLYYFNTLVEEVAQTSVREDYWQHVERNLRRFEAMWKSRAEAAARTSQETK
jgi:hypothetical protein